jgi:hypothetical protein
MSLMMGIFSNLFDFILDVFSLIPKFVYFLIMTLASFLDFAQLAIRKIAGLDVYYIQGVDKPQTGDIVLAFIRGIFEENSRFPALKNAFWSLVVLALVLIILTTIIAIIRQEYANNKELTTMNIVKRAVKGLFMFLIVPMSVMFGLLFSDVILQALDSATTGGMASSAIFSKEGVVGAIDGQGNDISVLVGETTLDGLETTYFYYDMFGISFPSRNVTFSGMIFKASAYNANRTRINKTYTYNDNGTTRTSTFYDLMVQTNPKVSNFNLFNRAENSYDAALMIDEAFAGNVHLKNPENLIFESPTRHDVFSTLVFKSMFKIKNFSKYDVSLVWYYYDLWQFNFIIAAAFYFFALKMMVKIVAGLAKRIIEMVALFLISPPIIALMPLDNEEALKKWRQNFMSKALMAYGAIVGMNLIFLILPYLYEIQFFDPSGFSALPSTGNPIRLINTLISTLFMLVALLTVEDFISLLSGFIGSKSAAEEGKDMPGKVGDLFQKSATAVAGATGIATSAVAGGAKIAARTGNAIGQKITGDKSYYIGKKSVGWAKSAANWAKTKEEDNRLKKVGRTKAGSAADSKVQSDFNEKWSTGGGAEQAYDSYLAEKGYTQGMNEAFEGRTDKNLSFDDWKASEEGQAAATKISKEKGIQSFDEFKSAAGGDGSGIYHKLLRKERLDNSKKYYKTLGDRVANGAGFIKNSAFTKNAINGLLQAGATLNTFYSFAPGPVKEALERGGKVSVVQTMNMAFGGKSAGEIKKEQDIAKIRGEEQAKARFYQNQNAGSNTQIDQLSQDLAGALVEIEKLKKANENKTDGKE